MKSNSLTKPLKKHTSGWVSLSANQQKVIASGKTLSEVLKKLEKMGNPSGFLMKAAKDYSFYTG